MGMLDAFKDIEFNPDKKAMGLINMGVKMMDASGPSALPVSFLQALGSGMGGFVEGVESVEDRDMAKQSILAKIKSDEIDAKYKRFGTGAMHPTAEGYVWQNPDSGVLEHVKVDGKNAVPSTSDTDLRRKMGFAEHSADPTKVTIDGKEYMEPLSSVNSAYANDKGGGQGGEAGTNYELPRNAKPEDVEAMIKLIQANHPPPNVAAAGGIPSVSMPMLGTPVPATGGINQFGDVIPPDNAMVSRRSSSTGPSDLAKKAVEADISTKTANDKDRNKLALDIAEEKRKESLGIRQAAGIQDEMLKLLYPLDEKGNPIVKRDALTGAFLPPNEPVISGAGAADRILNVAGKYSDIRNQRALNKVELQRLGKKMVLNYADNKLGGGTSNADLNLFIDTVGVPEGQTNINAVYNSFTGLHNDTERRRKLILPEEETQETEAQRVARIIRGGK